MFCILFSFRVAIGPGGSPDSFWWRCHRHRTGSLETDQHFTALQGTAGHLLCLLHASSFRLIGWLTGWLGELCFFFFLYFYLLNLLFNFFEFVGWFYGFIVLLILSMYCLVDFVSWLVGWFYEIIFWVSWLILWVVWLVDSLTVWLIRFSSNSYFY